MPKKLPNMLSEKQMKLQLGLRRSEKADWVYLEKVVFEVRRYFRCGHYSPTLQYDRNPEQDLSDFDIVSGSESDA